MRKDGILTSRSVGEVSSKYGYSNGGDLFEQDLQKHYEEFTALYDEFREWMKSKNVDPRQFRAMFTMYYTEFIERE